jgi:2,3-bisphosphoglycerate-independent phosphoglycerate mutase
MTTPTLRNVPCVLIIRDGWGRNPNLAHNAFNAVALARTPVADRIERDFPTTLIRTSGEDVGLPEGTMGNSEVGHQNIGAGRVVDQESVRITKAIRSGEFYDNFVLRAAVQKAKETGGAVHLLCIASDAGVHGQLEHLYACVELCKRLGHSRVYIHLFTDGRDTGPFTGLGYVGQVEARCAEIGVGQVASVIGRYYAMDRDNRWERVERAYICMTGRGARAADIPIAPSASAAVRAYYDKPTNDSQAGDEFIVPMMIGADVKDALARRITNGDSVIFVNYRGDRPRELCRAFVLPEFFGRMKPSPDTGAPGFDRGPRLNLEFATMTGYAEDLRPYVRVAFPKPPKMTNILGEWLSAHGVAQFRCAETEKFPHVTFFFNDYRDEPFEGERRGIVQSPRVATYDLKPEMSAMEVRDEVLARLRAWRDPDQTPGAPGEPVIVVNFANGDMVGHTGKLDAAVRACETVDACVGAVLDEALALGGCAIVTADHGNAEQMWDPATNAPHTAHTTYDVPLTVVGEAFRGRTLRDGGRLADIAPTLLDMIGLDKPGEMTGESLLVKG